MGDFVEFGQLMRNKYLEYYPPKLHETGKQRVVLSPQGAIASENGPVSHSFADTDAEDDTSMVLVPENADWQRNVSVKPFDDRTACCPWDNSSFRVNFSCSKVAME